MPSLSQLPSDLNRKKFVRALVKVGFEISERGGDGSHYKATWPSTQKSITIQYDFRKDVLYKTIKQIKTISGITWKEIEKKL